MKTIRRNEGITTLLFPDNQPHVTITGVDSGDEVRVVYSIQSSLDMMQLLMVADALDRLHAKKTDLFIPYLMGARYDRPMQVGGSFDLKIIARLINSMQFDRVHIFHPHSDVSIALIENSEAVSNKFLVQAYCKPKAILICPDAGAMKMVDTYKEWNHDIKRVTYCQKHRNVITGNINLNVSDPIMCAGENCVVIDDLCDGGGHLQVDSQSNYSETPYLDSLTRDILPWTGGID